MSNRPDLRPLAIRMLRLGAQTLHAVASEVAYRMDDAADDLERHPVRLENSRQKVYGVHAETQCAGDVCAIHHRSDHPLRHDPQRWNGNKRMMERVCTHGIVHPDPDDYGVQMGRAERLHTCDGCCS